MLDRKPWYASRTNITNIVTVISTFAVMFGLDLDRETQAGVVATVVGVGGALSTWFRNKATKQIG